ncbi:MAG: zinc ribbon domain-containing protein [Blastocatellia bacterium]|nr:zinc ribbon domain-containing protein [Blastocatellia bacterium]
MPMIRFTANHQDLSTDKGFQFKFFCDKCGNGYMSRFQTSLTGTAGSLLRAAGDLFGGFFHNAANSAYEVQRAVGGKAHDEAFEAAVQEVRQHFHQCTRCGKWVCPEMCWNQTAGLCEDCAPNFEEERAAARAQGARAQLHSLAHEVKLADAKDILNPAPATCPHCHAATTGGKFCPECGQALHLKQTCPGCQAELKTQAKFCPECGTKIPGWA